MVRYAWVDQDAVVLFYVAAFLLVILPYLIIQGQDLGEGRAMAGHQRGKP